MRSLAQLLAVIAAFGTDAVVQAQDEAQVRDWPQFHIGVAVGQSHLGPDWDSFELPELIKPNTSVDNNSTGRKLVAGFRPIRIVGAELQYVNFGEVESRSGGSPHSFQYGYYSLRSEAKATMLSAVLYIPHPSPLWDVYGKVGVARLEESFYVRVSDYSHECRLPPPAIGIEPLCMFDSQSDQTDSRPYLGIGARFKIAGAWALRIEYEAVDGDVWDSNTTMLSVGVAWEHY